jgi:hypothetical protein
MTKSSCPMTTLPCQPGVIPKTRSNHIAKLYDDTSLHRHTAPCTWHHAGCLFLVNTGTQLFSHLLCLDTWGAPSSVSRYYDVCYLHPHE